MARHIDEHDDPTCPVCIEEALNVLNDAQARGEVEQELDPEAWRRQWAER